jgi:hypothetical protein
VVAWLREHNNLSIYQQGLIEGAVWMISFQIKARPDAVGPPIDVVRLTRDGVTRTSRNQMDTNQVPSAPTNAPTAAPNKTNVSFTDIVAVILPVGVFGLVALGLYWALFRK